MSLLAPLSGFWFPRLRVCLSCNMLMRYCDITAVFHIDMCRSSSLPCSLFTPRADCHLICARHGSTMFTSTQIKLSPGRTSQCVLFLTLVFLFSKYAISVFLIRSEFEVLEGNVQGVFVSTRTGWKVQNIHFVGKIRWLMPEQSVLFCFKYSTQAKCTSFFCVCLCVCSSRPFYEALLRGEYQYSSGIHRYSDLIPAATHCLWEVLSHICESVTPKRSGKLRLAWLQWLSNINREQDDAQLPCPHYCHVTCSVCPPSQYSYRHVLGRLSWSHGRPEGIANPWVVALIQKRHESAGSLHFISFS